jgi:hypothetical protein
LADTEKRILPASMVTLTEDFQAAISKFVEANKGVTADMVLPMIIHGMLQFPYAWLKEAGNEGKFVEGITAEAAYFVAIHESMNEFQKAENA